MEGLVETDPAMRREIVNLSHGMGKDALPFLNQAIIDADGGVRLAALRHLIDIGEDTALHLEEALHDRDYKVRTEALNTIAEMGQSGFRFLSIIKPLLNDPKMAVQYAAEQTLRRIDPEHLSDWRAAFREQYEK